jgi:hypothetical protein
MYSDGSMFLIALALAAVSGLIVFGLLRLLKHKISRWFLIGFAVSLALLFFTFQKINKMNILLGNSEGRQTTTRKITRKWRDVYHAKGGSSREVPMLCFQNGGEVCVDVRDSLWNNKKEGESFSVVSAPGDDEFFHPTGIYLSEGNLDFDHGLLVVEILTALFCLVKILFPGFLAFDKFGKSNNIKLFDETGKAEE